MTMASSAPAAQRLSTYISKNVRCIDSSLHTLTCIGKGVTDIDINSSLLTYLLADGAPARVRREAELYLGCAEECGPQQVLLQRPQSHGFKLSDCDSTSVAEPVIGGGMNIALALSLHSIILARNKLTHLLGVVQFKHVVKLSLLGNRISRLESLEPLALLPALRYLSLEFNPVTTLPHYRPHVIRICCWPHGIEPAYCRLRKLDGVAISDAEVCYSSTCLLRELSMISDLIQRTCLAELLEQAWKRLEIHRELRLRGMLLCDAKNPFTVKHLMLLCANHVSECRRRLEALPTHAAHWKGKSAHAMEWEGSVLSASVHSARKLIAACRRPAQTTHLDNELLALRKDNRLDELEGRSEGPITSPVSHVDTNDVSFDTDFVNVVKAVEESVHWREARIGQSGHSAVPVARIPHMLWEDSSGTVNTANVYDVSHDSTDSTKQFGASCRAGLTASRNFFDSTEVSAAVTGALDPNRQQHEARGRCSSLPSPSSTPMESKMHQSPYGIYCDDWSSEAQLRAVTLLDTQIRSRICQLGGRIEGWSVADADVDHLLRMWLCALYGGELPPGPASAKGFRSHSGSSSTSPRARTEVPVKTNHHERCGEIHDCSLPHSLGSRQGEEGEMPLGRQWETGTLEYKYVECTLETQQKDGLSPSCVRDHSGKEAATSTLVEEVRESSYSPKALHSPSLSQLFKMRRIFAFWVHRVENRDQKKASDAFRLLHLASRISRGHHAMTAGASGVTAAADRWEHSRTWCKSVILKVWRQMAEERRASRTFCARHCFHVWGSKLHQKRMHAMACDAYARRQMCRYFARWTGRSIKQRNGFVSVSESPLCEANKQWIDINLGNMVNCGVLNNVSASSVLQPPEQKASVGSNGLSLGYSMSLPRPCTCTTPTSTPKHNALTAMSEDVSPREGLKGVKSTTPMGIISGSSANIHRTGPACWKSVTVREEANDEADEFVDDAEHFWGSASSAVRSIPSSDSSMPIPTPLPPEFSTLASSLPGTGSVKRTSNTPTARKITLPKGKDNQKPCPAAPKAGEAEMAPSVHIYEQQVKQLLVERKELVDFLFDAERRAQESRLEAAACREEVKCIRTVLSAMVLREECTQSSIAEYRSEIERQRKMIEALREERRAMLNL